MSHYKTGYARVSTNAQDEALQLDALQQAQVDRVFIDRASGSVQDRPGLTSALECARSGDSLMVWRLETPNCLVTKYRPAACPDLTSIPPQLPSRLRHARYGLPQEPRRSLRTDPGDHASGRHRRRREHYNDWAPDHEPGVTWAGGTSSPSTANHLATALSS